MTKLSVSLFTMLFIAISTVSLAESVNISQSTLDLSGLSSDDQGQANVVACLVECERNATQDARYERSRYDRYYETATGFVLSDPTDPDSELVVCSEIACEPPARRAAIGSICFARIDRLENFANCALKCTSIGRLYSESIFDDEPFSVYKQSATNSIVSMCERLNDSPFNDYDSTCPEIAYVDGEARDCSALNDVLESEAALSRQSRGVNLDDLITRPNLSSKDAPLK